MSADGIKNSDPPDSVPFNKIVIIIIITSDNVYGAVI